MNIPVNVNQGAKAKPRPKPKPEVLRTYTTLRLAMLINPLGIGPFNLLSLSRLSKQGNKLAFEKVLEKKLQNTVPRGGQWIGR